MSERYNLLSDCEEATVSLCLSTCGARGYQARQDCLRAIVSVRPWSQRISQAVPLRLKGRW